MATLYLDVVLQDGETPEQAAQAVAGKYDVTWLLVPSGNCHQGVEYTGSDDQLARVNQRYNALGKPKPHLKGKPPVGKGERRIPQVLEEVPAEVQALADEYGGCNGTGGHFIGVVYVFESGDGHRWMATKEAIYSDLSEVPAPE